MCRQNNASCTLSYWFTLCHSLTRSSVGFFPCWMYTCVHKVMFIGRIKPRCITLCLTSNEKPCSIETLCICSSLLKRPIWNIQTKVWEEGVCCQVLPLGRILKSVADSWPCSKCLNIRCYISQKPKPYKTKNGIGHHKSRLKVCIEEI